MSRVSGTDGTASIGTIAIVGAGQAAAVATRTLRRRGYDGRIELIGAEPEPPYQRPPLSKEYLADPATAGELGLLSPRWCEENGVRLRLGSAASGIDPSEGAVLLQGGGSVRADRVLVATGGRPRALPGIAGERVHTLRTRRDADRLRERLAPGARVVVVGAGFIGSEVAATARTLGVEVVLLEALDVPMRQLLGPRLGAVCAELHRANGVEVRFRQSVTSVVHGRDGVTVVTGTGARIDADAVVVGVGIEPDVDVVAGADIKVDNGIVVDGCCRTSSPSVFAAGDVANHYHALFGEHIRAEHVEAAGRLATTAADAMLGHAAPFTEPHWFYSDQYGLNLQYTGHAPCWDEVVVRGSLSDLDFCAFYLLDGVVRAAFAAERGEDAMAARELVSQQAVVEPDVLRDDSVDLFELMMEEAG
ncbi:NAD(FAD)-dependent dehydrogenase [Saccharomonospora marina XMU15]|uniref:NAD(FAD)-dependent dehydrogenase n=1 Tax=Saccharomonospora marina XMU15 TaxID=882083 RepID=H5X1R8_9PSEU|nr:NAD(FAD)-dependent dehydrogenase [Saccharomonospora marina XMU15]